jgi:Cu+-exporting ATPase
LLQALEDFLMPEDLAVVLDAAGTLLKMHRVAKDINTGRIIERVITWKLIMEKRGRALVVPQLDPAILTSLSLYDPIGSLLDGRGERFEISCSSTPVSKERAIEVIRRSKLKISDIQEVYSIVRAKCPHRYQTMGLIIDAELGEICYAMSTGGSPFPGLVDVLADLRSMGAEVYVASGDSMRSLSYLLDYGITEDRIYPVASPRRKREIVIELKKKYRLVVMVGDGLNDIYALEAADFAVLTVQQDNSPPPRLIKAADRIIRDLLELPVALKEVLSSRKAKS